MISNYVNWFTADKTWIVFFFQILPSLNMIVFPNILVNVSTLFHTRPDFLKKNTTIIEYDCIGLGTVSNSTRWRKLTRPLGPWKRYPIAIGFCPIWKHDFAFQTSFWILGKIFQFGEKKMTKTFKTISYRFIFTKV